MGSNRALGNSFERRLAERLHEEGFWVHLLTQNAAGQPADIIAVKDNRAVLIDAKVCSDGLFRTSRIESNQTGSLLKWEQCGNEEWWFALELPDGEIYMMPGLVAHRWELDHTDPVIRAAYIRKRFLDLYGWLERWEDRGWEHPRDNWK